VIYGIKLRSIARCLLPVLNLRGNGSHPLLMQYLQLSGCWPLVQAAASPVIADF
jgi:hypothetical protein